jgi:hypothetical protein
MKGASAGKRFHVTLEPHRPRLPPRFWRWRKFAAIALEMSSDKLRTDGH